MSENLLSISDSIIKINKVLQQIQSDIQKDPGLQDFETIELPFKLVEAGINLWAALYSPQVLRHLADADADTLDAWAIALSQTLNKQLAVLNNWLPHLSTLPISPTLTQRITTSTAEIQEINTKKSQLLQAATELFNQEQELRTQEQELRLLQQKEVDLTKIQNELHLVDLGDLRDKIATLSVTLEPLARELEQLQQQKAEIEEQVLALKQQQIILESEIEGQKHKQQRQQGVVLNKTQELISLTQAARAKLTEPLNSTLTDLEQQRSEYKQLSEQLQSSIQAFNKYLEETEDIRDRLNNHYQANQGISERLPLDCQKVNGIIQTIEQNLAELDREIASARKQHEISKQKTIFIF